ncbi:hypothetical protein [Haloferula rosea]|uniref:Uncharacterized protein n=1 Tax=Haloferula rosea TaxID=490093 RepID=A0A934VH85_9BACT|nr:hypothetical protein [Haloferula rosea]MBK1828811.1 hypothetical protein [Haloferula rosea]
MKLVRVGCESCGGNLEVNPRDRYVTCRYCDACLEVVHDDTAVASRVVRELVGENELLANKVEYFETRKRLEEFDKDWEARKAPMLWRWKEARFEPNGVMAFSQALILWAVALVFFSSFEIAVSTAAVIGGLGAAAFLEWRRWQIRRFRAEKAEMLAARLEITKVLDGLRVELGLPDGSVNGTEFVAEPEWESAYERKPEERYQDFF